MLFWIIIFIIIFFFYYIISNKIHIDWKSLFKGGFPKKDDLFGLYTYEGFQGEGKTLSATKFCFNTACKYNYIIITNVMSFKSEGVRIEYEQDIFKLLDKVKAESKENNKYIIFFDEIFTVLQKSVKNPRAHEILEFLAQLRKRHIIFITTAQDWGEIPIAFRKFSRFKIHCHMFNMPILNCAFHLNQVFDGYNVKWSDELQDFEGPLLQTNFSKCNLFYADMYDTFETINTSFKRAEKKAERSEGPSGTIGLPQKVVTTT